MADISKITIQSYSDFRKWKRELLSSNTILGSHGTNSFVAKEIVEKELLPRQEITTNFTGENLLKRNTNGNDFVSVSVSKDKTENYPYFLTMGLYYAERISAQDMPNRNTYLTDYLLKKYIIQSEGGEDSYAKLILERKKPDFTQADVKDMVKKIEKELESVKNDNYIPKYLFKPEYLANQLKVIGEVLELLGAKEGTDNLLDVLKNEDYLPIGTEEYYKKEIAKEFGKQLQGGRYDEIEAALNSLQKEIEELIKSYNNRTYALRGSNLIF